MAAAGTREEKRLPRLRCPRCDLAIRRLDDGAVRHCPRCGESIGGGAQPEHDAFTQLLLMACVVADLFICGLFLAMAVGPVLSTLIVGVVAGCILAVWLGRLATNTSRASAVNRKPIDQRVQRSGSPHYVMARCWL